MALIHIRNKEKGWKKKWNYSYVGLLRKEKESSRLKHTSSLLLPRHHLPFNTTASENEFFTPWTKLVSWKSGDNITLLYHRKNHNSTSLLYYPSDSIEHVDLLFSSILVFVLIRHLRILRVVVFWTRCLEEQLPTAHSC